MSGLNPGGNRAKGPRVFTAEGVARVCRQAKKAEADRGGCSIATSEHAHSREVQRRLRQAERRKERTP